MKAPSAARGCDGQMVREFTPEQRCRFLQFVTGTSRVPATGFKDLWGAHTAARGRRQQRARLLTRLADP